jgi:acyl-CoA thioesterase I
MEPEFSHMAATAQPCDPHLDLVKFTHSLPHLTESLQSGRRTRIVAIGSSSTAGEPSPVTREIEIVPYPARLELALRKHHYGRMIDVLNRGLGGQEAPEELSRFESDVIGEKPALVIWQIGSNAVFHQPSYSYDDVQAAIATGLEWLAGLPIDVVLMDLQYTRKIKEINDGSKANGPIGPDGTKMGFADDIELRIATVAQRAGVNLFKRWALMQQWVADDIGISVDDLTDPDDKFDHLHMSELATACVSRALFGAIENAPPPKPPAAT